MLAKDKEKIKKLKQLGLAMEKQLGYAHLAPPNKGKDT